MASSQTVMITGGTGLVGKKLAEILIGRGYAVIILTRNPQKAASKNKLGNQVTYAAWDVNKQTIDVSAVSKADHIIHLAGAGVVDHRWTDAYKKEIVDSRVESSKLIIQTLAQNKHHVKTFVSASATGWYGADTEKSRKEKFTEEAPANDDFLGQTCFLWEQSVNPVEQLGIRRVTFRTGIVLAKDGGAMAEFKKPINFGVAGILGNGKQIVSWIHIEDQCGMYLYAIENEHLHGIYNAVAPAPASNQKLTLQIAKAMGKSWAIKMHIPAFVLKLLLGGSSIEVLKSTTVSSQKIEKAGYLFKYPAIEEAVASLVK